MKALKVIGTVIIAARDFVRLLIWTAFKGGRIE